MVEVDLWWKEDEQIKNLMKKGERKHLDPFPDKAQTGVEEEMKESVKLQWNVSNSVGTVKCRQEWEKQVGNGAPGIAPRDEVRIAIQPWTSQ